MPLTITIALVASLSATNTSLPGDLAQVAPPSNQRPTAPAGRGAPTPPAGRSAPPIPAGSTARAGAPLRIEPPQILLGAVAPRSQNPIKFTIRNVSSKPVTIIEAKASCKCTTMNSLDGTVLEPGGTAVIDATMDAPSLPGEKDAHIYITYDEAERAVVASVRAVVRMEVEADPPFVDIRGGKLQTIVKVKAFDGKPFRVVSAGGEKPRYGSTEQIAAARKGEARTEWQMMADFGSIPSDRIMQYWIVEIDRDDCPIVPVQVRHELTGVKWDEARNTRQWMFGDSLVNAGRIRANEPYEGTIEITEYSPERGASTPPPPTWSQVLSIRCVGPEGSAEMLGTDSHGSKVVLRYRFTPNEKSAGRCIYAPIEVTTPTGTGRFYLTASVAAPPSAPPAPTGGGT